MFETAILYAIGQAIETRGLVFETISLEEVGMILTEYLRLLIESEEQ